MADYFVGAYWSAREESQEACAKRIAAFLQALAAMDTGLSQWFEKMDRKDDPLVEIAHDAASLSSQLTTNKKDIGKEVIKELGFSFSAWSGPDSRLRSEVSVLCGAFSKHVPNSAIVDFSPDVIPSADLLRQILLAQTKAFDPDNGVVRFREVPGQESKILMRYDRGKGLSAKLA